MFVTITPQNSVHSPTTAHFMDFGDGLSLLWGAYLAGDQIGLNLAGKNSVTIMCQVSGGALALRAVTSAEILLGTSGVLLGNVSADGADMNLTFYGQVYGDVTVTAARLGFANHGLIVGSVDLMAGSGQNHLQNHGQITGLLRVDGYDLDLDLGGSSVAVVKVLAQSISLTGHDIHASGHVVISTKGGPFPNGILEMVDVDGSHFDGGLTLRNHTIGILDLTGGVTADFLRLKGYGFDVDLAGSNVSFLYVTTSNSLIDARDSFGLPTVRFGRGDDRFFGNDLGQQVIDGGGSDIMTLGSGDDTYCSIAPRRKTIDVIDGGAGHDMMYCADFKVDGYIDLASGRAGFLSARHTATTALISFTGFEAATGGSGDDLIRGNNAANVAFGYLGNDLIFCGAGNDTLSGYLGDDTLTGGAGADVFQFLSRGGADTIRDFQQGLDLMDLTVTDADLAQPGMQAFAFIGLQNTPPTRNPPDGTGQISYAHLAGDTVVTITLPGFSAHPATITLHGIVTLT